MPRGEGGTKLYKAAQHTLLLHWGFPTLGPGGGVQQRKGAVQMRSYKSDESLEFGQYIRLDFLIPEKKMTIYLLHEITRGGPVTWWFTPGEEKEASEQV